MKISTLTASAESPLLDLPLELRMLIYELVLCPGTAINLRWQINMIYAPNQPQVADRAKQIAEGPAFNVLKTSDVDCALLRVCKMVQHEANEMFYSRNTFRIYSGLVEYTPGFLDSIGERNAKLITRLEVTDGKDGKYQLSTAPPQYWFSNYSSRDNLTAFYLKQLCKRLPGLLELKMSDLRYEDWRLRRMIANLYRFLREIKPLTSTADEPSFKLLCEPDSNYVRLAAAVNGLRQTARVTD